MSWFANSFFCFCKTTVGFQIIFLNTWIKKYLVVSWYVNICFQNNCITSEGFQIFFWIHGYKHLVVSRFAIFCFKQLKDSRLSFQIHKQQCIKIKMTLYKTAIFDCIRQQSWLQRNTYSWKLLDFLKQKGISWLKWFIKQWQ